jgi:hypothetical protein
MKQNQIRPPALGVDHNTKFNRYPFNNFEDDACINSMYFVQRGKNKNNFTADTYADTLPQH